ncbi:hypothetical protein [Moorena sp. SIO3A2]|uniref:hypothetical protein n=1 Tax=Moorena sp. SIO3A2 TaxID=2607841 RepID=UPI0013BC889D|nr:hypothetical protein [Moorena sp. SIO3A2]NER90339.1 hypothetical protein [Moorena sp. SIO3A2]
MLLGQGSVFAHEVRKPYMDENHYQKIDFYRTPPSLLQNADKGTCRILDGGNTVHLQGDIGVEILLTNRQIDINPLTVIRFDFWSSNPPEPKLYPGDQPQNKQELDLAAIAVGTGIIYQALLQVYGCGERIGINNKYGSPGGSSILRGNKTYRYANTIDRLDKVGSWVNYEWVVLSGSTNRGKQDKLFLLARHYGMNKADVKFRNIEIYRDKDLKYFSGYIGKYTEQDKYPTGDPPRYNPTDGKSSDLFYGLKVAGNSWKILELSSSFVVNRLTYCEFWYKVPVLGEAHAVGFFESGKDGISVIGLGTKREFRATSSDFGKKVIRIYGDEELEAPVDVFGRYDKFHFQWVKQRIYLGNVEAFKYRELAYFAVASDDDAERKSETVMTNLKIREMKVDQLAPADTPYLFCTKRGVGTDGRVKREQGDFVYQWKSSQSSFALNTDIPIPDSEDGERFTGPAYHPVSATQGLTFPYIQYPGIQHVPNSLLQSPMEHWEEFDELHYACWMVLDLRAHSDQGKEGTLFNIQGDGNVGGKPDYIRVYTKADRLHYKHSGKDFSADIRDHLGLALVNIVADDDGVHLLVNGHIVGEEGVESLLPHASDNYSLTLLSDKDGGREHPSEVFLFHLSVSHPDLSSIEVISHWYMEHFGIG